MADDQDPIETPKRGPGRPKGYSPTKDKAPKGASPRGNTWVNAKSIEVSLNETIMGIGLGVKLLNSFDGETIISGAPKLSSALVDLATNDPRYRKYLESASAPGKYGPLIMAVGGIALPIAMNHGLFDPKPKKVEEIKVDPVFDPTPVAEENIDPLVVPSPTYSGDSDNVDVPTSADFDNADLYNPLGDIHEE